MLTCHHHGAGRLSEAASGALPMSHFSHHRGFRPYLSQLQAIQASFGFTQQEVADLLGVSRSALSMYERGSRNLPLAAQLRLRQFAEALPDPAPAPPPAPVLSPDERADLALRRQGLLLQLDALARPLARSQTRLAQAQLRQRLLPGLQAQVPATEKLAHIVFTLWEGQAALTLQYEPSVLAQLLLRRDVLAFEVAGIARLLAESPAGDP